MMTLIEKINGWHPVFISIGAVGFSFINQIELVLRISVLVVALGYSIWKWIKEYKKHKNETHITKV